MPAHRIQLWKNGLALSLCVGTAGFAGCGGSRVVTVTAAGQATPTPKSASTSSAQRSFPTLVADVRSGVVQIDSTTCNGEAIGTGFLVGKQLVATVEHVVDGSAAIVIKRDGTVLGSATVIGDDPARDLALLRTAHPIDGHVFKLAPRAPQLGEGVAALGFPFGLPLTVTRGSVSGLDRSIPIVGLVRRRLVQTDAAVNPGNSGGPLLSSDTGVVVGLVDLGATQANGLAFAVSAQVASPLLQAWAAAPQAVPAANCANSNLPAAAPAQAGSASGASAVADAIYGYWDAIRRSDYATAFTYLSPSEQQQLGGEQTFVSQHAADPLQGVAVRVAVSSVGSGTATVSVVRLQTTATSTGCRNWSGSYQLVNEGGSWLIASAKLNFSAC
jgi:serine protease Do